jgi:hypothetical protein
MIEKRRSDWGVMQKLVIGPHDDPYMTRWHLIKTPIGGLYLHKMSRPDRRPICHDHPWNFRSLVLRGGYVEMRLDPFTRQIKANTIRRYNRMRALDAHYIVELLRPTTWTLVVVGRQVRTWGYWMQASDAIGPETDRLWAWEPWHLTKDDTA